MSDFLWCSECRQSFLDEERIFFAQRCTDCGGLLERDEPGRCEIDYKEIDIGYREEEGDEEEQLGAEEHEEESEDQEDSDDTETDGEQD
ncbi:MULTISPECIES: hypothetical protein [unclassified Bradyrhizobium]|uniref:hypothetical protein n=1 Tax=Bradyrhizobium sp. USDA 4541 TaxID=2817704 RepID=UPI0020A32F8E|nr:hypothetical protein [Bradyrhizobium sp. USDA 4541]MCP1846817.1 hypothetical protein [Bradyrhizobium sp. USDA 4541]